MKFKKTRWILIVLITAIVLLRIAAPYYIEDKVNQAVANNPEVTGGITDVDLWVLSGRASFDGLSISKADTDIPAPILSAEGIAFSISWRDLFRGRLFGDIELTRPVLNIVDGKRESDTQTGAEIDWRRALTSFYPFEINRIYVNNGEVHFRNFKSDPPVDIYLESIEAEALNITNELEVEESRAAQVTITATTIGSGQVSVSSEFNLLREPAKARINASVTDLNLQALNDFSKAYANLDIQAGVFNVEGNLNLQESNEIAELSGEISPIATNIDVLRWREDVEVQEDPGLIIAWEGLVDGVKWLLEAGPKDRLETTVPIKGSLENPDIGVGSAVWGLIKNAVKSWFDTDDAQESEPDKEPQPDD